MPTRSELNATINALITPQNVSDKITAAEHRATNQAILDYADQQDATKVDTSRTINGQALTSNITLTKSDIGLSNVPNVDATNPINIVLTAAHRFVTDVEKANWNAKAGTNNATTSVAGLMSPTDKTKIDAISGTNTGDETATTIRTKLGVTTLSGVNTGDETATTIRTKLGVTTLSGSNTGDETSTTVKTKLGEATASVDGYLKATDHVYFSSKADPVDFSFETLTYASTINWSYSKTRPQTQVTANSATAASATLNIVNALDGEMGHVVITYTTGSEVITLPGVLFPGKVLSPIAGKKDFCYFEKHGGTFYWDILNEVSNTNTTPTAPTNGVVDDTADTFNWTNSSGFSAVSDYEYTLDGGNTATTVTSKPISVGNVAKAIGQVGVRIKAATGRNPSSWLFNATGYTLASEGEDIPLSLLNSSPTALTESPAGTWTGDNTMAVGNKFLPANTAGYMVRDIPSLSGANLVAFGFSPNSGTYETVGQIAQAIYLEGTAIMKVGSGTPVNTGHTMTAGASSKIRLRRTTTDLFAEYTTDGTNWTTAFTWLGVNGIVYPKFAIYASLGTRSIVNPKVSSSFV